MCRRKFSDESEFVISTRVLFSKNIFLNFAQKERKSFHDTSKIMPLEFSEWIFGAQEEKIFMRSAFEFFKLIQNQSSKDLIKSLSIFDIIQTLTGFEVHL